MVTSKIEQLLVELEPKFLSQVQDYLEYLIFLQQQKHKSHKETQHTQASPKNNPLSDLRHFNGDAPFPNVSVSKSDIYEQ
jgi:hypothetical protein